MNIRPDVEAFADELTAWRRDMHRNPELGYHETRTSQLVAERLESFGIEVHRGLGGTGVVGVLRGSLGDGPAIGLRADMDALPMQEAGNPAHRSSVDGVFHGCGHDGHTTMLLGAARSLAFTRQFTGTVHFIFQPAEEGLAGARAMIEDGLFERFPCDEVYGMHNWPQLELGTASIRPGPVMAASDKIDIEVTGRGAHAAMPHRGVDPVAVSAHIITALQTIVSRGTDPQDAAVVSITAVHTGSTYNVIPGSAKLMGTCRSFRPETRERLEAEVERVATRVAEALGASATVKFTRGYPPTVNHPAATARFARAASSFLGAESVIADAAPSMGGEDFAFMLEEVPGSYLWLGQGGSFDLHHPQYDFNDALLPVGASLWAELIERID